MHTTQEEYVFDAISDDGEFVTIAPSKTLTFKESLEALFDTRDVRDDVLGSTTAYMTESRAAVERAAREVGGQVVATSNKVAGEATQLGNSIRSTFVPSPAQQNERVSLLSSQVPDEQSGGTFV